MTLEMQTALERELKDAKTPEDRALALPEASWTKLSQTR